MSATGLRASRGDRLREGGATVLLVAPIAVALATLGALLADVLADGLPVLDRDFLTSFASIDPERAGVWAGIVGSVLLVVVCVAAVLPLGVATAVYLEEYADRRRLWVRLLDANLQNLASVPSIVYGILGLAFLVRGPLSLGNVLVAGGLTLALLVLPLVVITARDALRAVPREVRDAAYALGASRWQVTWRVVLPAAVPGIATGVVLAVAEALGQAAPLLVVGAASFMAFNPEPFGAFTALPVQIYSWSARPQEEFQALAAGAILVLLALLLVLNAAVLWVRNRFERRW